LENGTYLDPEKPTVAEIQAVINAKNAEISYTNYTPVYTPTETTDDTQNNEVLEIKPIVHSLGGEVTDSENVVNERVEIPVPVVSNSDVNLLLEGANENGEVVVKGEGTWSVEDGKIVFSPEDGFVYDPTPIKYTIVKEDGTKLPAETVEVNYPGLLRDDNVSISSDLKEPVVLDVLKNDNGDLNVSTIKLVVPEGFMDEHPGSTFDKNGTVLKVEGEGIWRVLDNGTISYEPLTDAEPTPIRYQVYDNTIKKVLSSADIKIQRTAVAGVSMEANQTTDSKSHKHSNSVPTLNKWGTGLILLLASLFGMFFFRREKK